MEPHETRPGAADRSRGRRIALWTVFWLGVAVALVWAIWGFRWPPTVATISQVPVRPDVETAAGIAVAAPAAGIASVPG